MAVAADLLGVRLPRRLARGQAVVVHAPPVPLDPGRIAVGAQPVGGRDG